MQDIQTEAIARATNTDPLIYPPSLFPSLVLFWTLDVTISTFHALLKSLQPTIISQVVNEILSVFVVSTQRRQNRRVNAK